MNIKYILKQLEKYTNIPRLEFEFEAKEYIYMANTMNQINYILKNINLIEGYKKNLKLYKDDVETVRNIREGINYYEETIEKSLIELEENYIQHCGYIQQIDYDMGDKYEPDI